MYYPIPPYASVVTEHREGIMSAVPRIHGVETMRCQEEARQVCINIWISAGWVLNVQACVMNYVVDASWQT